MDYKKILAKITRQWPAKIISIAVALILFAFHRMGDLQERVFSVPLQINSSSLTPGSAYPRNIRVTLKGDADHIFLVAENEIEAWLDLTQYREPGQYKVPVTINKKGAAFETELLQISLDPAVILLELDTMMSKQFSVTPVFQGHLESGYEMVSYTLDPERVIIDGPAKQIAAITGLSTEQIDLRRHNSDFSARVRIVNPNPFLTLRGGGTTEFKGFIRDLILIKHFDTIPISISGLHKEFEAAVVPPYISTRIHGPQKELSLLEESNIFTVDCSAITEPGVYELPLHIMPLPELTINPEAPNLITVTVIQKEDK